MCWGAGSVWQSQQHHDAMFCLGTVHASGLPGMELFGMPGRVTPTYVILLLTEPSLYTSSFYKTVPTVYRW